MWTINAIVYPVILTYENDVIYVSLPNFNEDKCLTYGDTLEEAIKSAKEILTLELSDLIQEKHIKHSNMVGFASYL